MMLTNMLMGLALAMVQSTSPYAGLDCARQEVSQAEREAMADALSSGGDASPFTDEVGARLRTCAEGAGHDGDTGRAFMALAFTTLAGEALRERLAARDIDPAIVDGWYAGQDETARIEYPDAAASERMVLDLAAAGVSMEALEAHGAILGNYLATLIIPERIARGLPPQ